MRGLFVVFEGVDCVGKTTVMTRVADMLRELGHRVHVTREPSSSPIGKLIRDWLLRESVEPHHVYALLFTADRYYHYHNEIRRALDEERIVLCERYVESTIAYQSAYGLDVSWLEELNKYLPRPDVTIVLDAPIEVVVERMRLRSGRDVFERDVEMLARVREVFLRRAAERGYVVINAIESVESVSHEALRVILDRLTTRGLSPTRRPSDSSA